MPSVIGVRFKSCGKIYDFELEGFDVSRGDHVVVESEFGVNIGRVVMDPTTVDDGTSRKKVLRKATDEDRRQKEENREYEKEARSYCLERIMARGLQMNLVCTEATLDKRRIIFYFTADGRIDFRELVKDLAAKFKTRIEMRQIGVRDKAKLVGGLGLCGKEFCCRLFLTSFEPISIKMAKQQDLVLNTSKLSGTCGRLMCCLGFEYHSDSQAGSGPAGQGPEQSESNEEEREQAADIRDEVAENLSQDVCCALPSEAPSDSGQIRTPGPEGAEQATEGQRQHRKRRRRHRKRGPRNE